MAVMTAEGGDLTVQVVPTTTGRELKVVAQRIVFLVVIRRLSLRAVALHAEAEVTVIYSRNNETVNPCRGFPPSQHPLFSQGNWCLQKLQPGSQGGPLGEVQSSLSMSLSQPLVSHGVSAFSGHYYP